MPLDRLRDRVERPDESCADRTRERAAALGQGLGVLEGAATWFAAAQGTCPPHDFGRTRVVLFAGDHGIAAGDARAVPAAERVEALLAGRTPVNALAELANASIRIVDIAADADLDPALSGHKVRRGSDRFDRGDAVTLEQVRAGLQAGMAVADEEVDSGADLLVADAVGAGTDIAAAVVVATALSLEPTAVVPRAGNDQAWMSTVMAVRDGLRRARLHRFDCEGLLQCVGGTDLAALVGFLIQAAIRRTPVLLDGIACVAAAVVARDEIYDAADWWFAGHRSSVPSHREGLDALGLSPLLDLDAGLGHGEGALLVLPLIRQSIRAVAADPETPEQQSTDDDGSAES